VLVVVVLLVAGCGAVDKRKAIKNCDFEIRAARVEDKRIRSATIAVDLDVYNPNHDEVIVDDLEYCVWSEDRCFMRGRVVTPVTIPPYEKRPMVVKADVSYFSTAAALKRLVLLQPTRYQMTGTVYLRTIFGRIPFKVRSKVHRFP